MHEMQYSGSEALPQQFWRYGQLQRLPGQVHALVEQGEEGAPLLAGELLCLELALLFAGKSGSVPCCLMVGTVGTASRSMSSVHLLVTTRCQYELWLFSI